MDFRSCGFGRAGGGIGECCRHLFVYQAFTPCVDAIDLRNEIKGVHSDARIKTLQIAEVCVSENLSETEEKCEDIALRAKHHGADAEKSADERPRVVGNEDEGDDLNGNTREEQSVEVYLFFGLHIGNQWVVSVEQPPVVVPLAIEDSAAGVVDELLQPRTVQFGAAVFVEDNSVEAHAPVEVGSCR